MKKFVHFSCLTLLVLIAQLQVQGQQQRDIKTHPAFIKKLAERTIPAVSQRTSSCASDSIVFTRQSQIDSFPITNPGCTSLRFLIVNGLDASPAITNLDSLRGIEEITWDLSISHTSITTLGDLESLRSVTASIWIDDCPLLTSINLPAAENLNWVMVSYAPALTSLAGFSTNLIDTQIEFLLMNNTGISDLTGLENIDFLNTLWVWANPNLTSLQGVNSLAQCHDISLFGNPALTDISALSNITDLQWGRLEISYNQSLSDLSGIGNIVHIGDVLWLNGNGALTTLDALNPNLQIDNVNNDTVRIEWNFNLSVCSVTPICNYLNGGGTAIIHDNAPGCGSISEILANCGLCTVINLKTWTGNVSDSWDDADNWSPAGVPSACDSVVIPSGLGTYPILNNSVSIYALTMEQFTTLDLAGNSLTITGRAYIEDATIYYGNSLKIINGLDAYIAESEITADDLIIQNHNGPAYLSNNSIYANVTISDASSRVGDIATGGNYISGNLTVSKNSTDFNSSINISYSGSDWVDGHITLNAYQPEGYFNLGSDELSLGGNLNINSDFNEYISLHNLRFVGFSDGHITQLGSAPISLNNVYTDRVGNIIPDQDVFITGDFRFGFGKVITEQGKMLVFKDGAYVSQTSSGSYVEGPLKKIGSQGFRFPIGGGNYQAVLDISAPPSPTDTVVAQYHNTNPTLNGYNSASHEASLTSVSNTEYWTLQYSEGPAIGRVSNLPIRVALSYDSTRSGVLANIYSLRVTSWTGTQWQNEGASEISGNLHQAFVTSAADVNNPQVFTIGFVVPPRIPIITVGSVDTLACNTNYPLQVPVSVDTIMFSNNQFIAQLSDASGSFASPLNIGTRSGNNSGNITATIPASVTPGSGYQIRVIGTAPADTSINTSSLRIIASPNVIVSNVGPDTVCANSGIVKYYASSLWEMMNHQWSLSGGGTMTTNNDTAYISWTTPGTYFLVLDLTNICGYHGIQSKQVVVRPAVPDSVPGLLNTGRWLYASAPPPNVNITGYRWFRNDTLISGANSNSYYASEAGEFSVRFGNLCGQSPESNSISFATTSQPQTITFPAIPDKTYGDSAFLINATSTSGFPVLFNIISGPGSIAGNIYTITTTGTVTVRAMQPGDNTYDTAAYISRTFTVNKAAQTINFPAIADQVMGTPAFSLNATASSSLPVQYNLVSGPATLSGNQITITGLGSISVNASQPGDTNYLAATTVNRTFCSRVAELSSISGPLFVCPGQTAEYGINNVAGLTYSWRLSNGTNFGSTTNTTDITWNTPGTFTLIVSATGPCGAPTENDSLTVNVINAVTPGAVSNMLPANGAINQTLPLTVSWIPGSDNLTYDLFVWDSAAVEPTIPFAANLTSVSYNIGLGTFPFNRTYKWKVVSKNACLQTAGNIQQFRLKPLPDLLVSEVQAPSTAFSGQTITINWKVSNLGPGNTTTNQSWTDAVFLSFDTIPSFGVPPNTNPGGWSMLDFPIRPLLIGTKTNVTALDSGQHYTNSMDFTLPLNYSQPLYAYVITNYPAGGNAPQQMTVINDTARAPQPIAVTLSPTPDLRVDTVLTPASVFSGSVVNITYKVKNYGVLTPVGANWTDKLYISTSPLFNINTALPLKAVKPNGSYYPNALDLTVVNTAQVQQDSSYSKSVQAVIPNFIFGTYFIYVVTNSTASMYEGALANNNVQQAQLQVFLTPTPQLTIGSLTIPVTTASVTQPIGVNWNIFNTGFNDNIEKSKGHYYVSAGNSVCNSVPGISLVDSLGFGSSYWIDRVYLSTDGSGLNLSSATLIGESAHGTQFSGYGVPDNLLPGYCLPPGSDPATLNQNTHNVIRPSSNHPKSYNFNIPSQLLQGNYYVYVVTNATQTVYEYPGTLQVKRSDAPITIQRPDATVPVVTVPSNTVGGQQFNVQYQVLNNGPGAVFNHARKDRVYVSSSSVFDGTATLLATLEFNESLPVGSSVQHVYQHTFSAGTTGARYFYVRTNFDSLFRENNYANNTSAAAITNVSSAVANDLTVASIQIADTVSSYQNNFLKYTVANNGSGTTTGNWTDSLFISCSPVYDPSSSYFVALRSHDKIVTGGEAYSDSFNLVVPFSFRLSTCFPETMFSTAYFFVKTNANNIVFEGSSTGNNVLGSGPRIFFNTLVDHTVTSVSGPDTATVARSYSTTWTVKNIGYNPGPGEYVQWYDGIYFSPDSVFNANAVLATHFFENSTLQNNQSYSRTKTVVPPNLPTGDYYVFANTNFNSAIPGEKVLGNNKNLIRNGSGAAKKIHLIQPLLPDLRDSILEVQPNAALGQPLTMVHRISNAGAGPSYPNNWSNHLWLSTDFIPGNAGDVLLHAKNHNGTLGSGSFINDTVSANIALNTTPGNYILISVTDVHNSILETDDNNNLAFQFVTVFSPAPTDLFVQQISKPDTVLLGYNMTPTSWVIGNNAPNTATGISADGIYLSKNSTLDSTAVLMGVVNKTLNIAPLGTSTVVHSPLITNVVEGSYQVIVKTDLQNNIVETNKDNNTGTAATSVYVKVKELFLGVQENNTLANIGRYYKLNIPDSLSGSTILVTLKTNDSLTVKNEMYIGHDYVPTAAQFDYKFETANYGNQQIVMSSVVNGVYYILVRCITPAAPVQNITLNAVKLPFAILNVQSGSGGNTGNVTVRISGSLFAQGMTARLEKPGTTINASTIYFTNSTSVFATFNLQGKPLGLYDVILSKADTATAILAGAFSIVPTNNGGLITGGGVNTGQTGPGTEPGCDPGAAAGFNSQLVTELVVPENFFIGWPFVIQINYANPTNVDVPAQVRILYNDKDVPMAFTQEGLNNGTSSLYLELTEPGGPPGIIRAGASGTITIYAKAPLSMPGHTEVKFNLK